MTGFVDRASPAERLRTLSGWRAACLMAVMLSGPPLMALTFSAIAPALPAIAQHFSASGMGATLAQWIMTMPAIGLMLGAPVGGWLIDRVGARRLVIASLAGFALGGSAGLWAGSPWPLLAGRFIMGLSSAGVATVATWLIGMRYEEEQRRRLIAAQDSISGGAALGAVLLAGLLTEAADWRLPFALYLVAVPVLAAALAGVPALPRSPMPSFGQPKAGYAALAPLWPVYAIIVSMAGLMMMPATQVPFLLKGMGVVSPVIQSRVIACSALMAIIGAAAYPLMRRRLGEAGTLRFMMGTYIVGTATLALTRDALTAGLGCLAMGTATGLFSPFFANVLLARTEPGLRGRAIGLMYGGIFLGEFLTPAWILPLRQAFGVDGAFVALAGLLTAGLLASCLRRPFRA